MKKRTGRQPKESSMSAQTLTFCVSTPMSDTITLRCRHCDGVEIVQDRGAGNEVCSSCGAIVCESIIDQTKEWRDFAYSDRTGDDPSRVGDIYDPRQIGGGLNTLLKGEDRDAIRRLMNAESTLSRNPIETKLRKLFDTIEEQVGVLRLPDVLLVCLSLFPFFFFLSFLSSSPFFLSPRFTLPLSFTVS